MKHPQHSKAQRPGAILKATALATLLATSSAHAFDSGSTGADGALAPAANSGVVEIQLPESGILNYTTVNIPVGVTLKFKRNTLNTPVVMLASGNVTIAGGIDVSGGHGAYSGTLGDGNLADDGVPGKGGPGGFDGGRGGGTVPSNLLGGAGLGPGGGKGGIVGTDGCSGTRYYKAIGGGAGHSGNGTTQTCGAIPLSDAVGTLADWTINPPPTDDKFVQIANAASEQRVADPRYPGFEVVLPAGATITGWDGVKKTRIAVERLTPDKLPVSAPPISMKEAYQLYFGSPMGGIPSEPIPVTLPNVSDKEPGEKVDIWWFDGSPMGGTGQWKKAGEGTVSEDGQRVVSDPGVGLPRFCGVCGLACIDAGRPKATETNKTSDCPKAEDAVKAEGNPIDLYSGQALAREGGLSCGGTTPLSTAWQYTPIDPFNNKGGITASFGLGWTFNHDAVLIPFEGSRKRLVMPGGVGVNFVADPNSPGSFRVKGDPRYDGFTLRQTGSALTASGRDGAVWEVRQRDGSTLRMEPFTDVLTRGGITAFVTRMTDRNGNQTTITRNAKGRIQRIDGSQGRQLNFTQGANGFVSQVQDHTGRTQNFEYNAEDRLTRITDAAGRSTAYTYHEPVHYNNTPADKTATACYQDTELSIVEPTESSLFGLRKYPHQRNLASITYPNSSTPTVNTHNTDRVVKQTTSTGETWQFSYRRVGACVVKVADEAQKTWAYSCRAGQSLSQRVLPSGATSTDLLTGTCPEVDSEEARQQGWRFYGGPGHADRQHDGSRQSPARL